MVPVAWGAGDTFSTAVRFGRDLIPWHWPQLYLLLGFWRRPAARPGSLDGDEAQPGSSKMGPSPLPASLLNVFLFFQELSGFHSNSWCLDQRHAILCLGEDAGRCVFSVSLKVLSLHWIQPFRGCCLETSLFHFIITCDLSSSWGSALDPEIQRGTYFSIIDWCGCS